MNCSLGQVILSAGNSDGEDTIWINMLVFVVLAALWGIYSVVKARAKQFSERQQYYPAGVRRPETQLGRQIKHIKELRDKCVGIFSKTVQPKVVSEERVFNVGDSPRDSLRRVSGLKRESKPGNGRNLTGGMQMLELNLLLGIIEKTKGNNKNNVMMRKLSFNELYRRKQLKAADSNVLKVYAINKGNLYGKDIQCSAMEELTKRTALLAGQKTEIRSQKPEKVG